MLRAAGGDGHIDEHRGARREPAHARATGDRRPRATRAALPAQRSRARRLPRGRRRPQVRRRGHRPRGE